MKVLLEKLGHSEFSSIIVALCYAFSGWMSVWIEWNIHGFVYALLPLLLFAVHERRLFLTIIISSLMAFAGHPQMAFIGFVAAGLFSLVNQKMKFLMKTMVVVGLVTSIQWIPLFRYYQQAGRERLSKEFSYADTLFQWSQLPRLIVPNFFGNPATENYTGSGNFVETTSYVGIALVAFALYGMFDAKRRLFPAALLGVVVFFAFPSTFSTAVGTLQIPILSTSVASRWLMVFPLAISLLAAVGVDRVLKGQILPKWPAISITIIMSILWFWVLSGSDPIRLTARRNLILPTGILAITVAPLIFLKRSRFMILPLATVYLLLITVSSVSELSLFAHKTMTYTELRFLYPEVPVLTELQKRSSDLYRFAGTEGGTIESNFATWYGLYDIAGYDALYPSRVGELVWAAHQDGIPGGDYSRSTVVTPTNKNKWRETLWSLAGVKWVLYKDDSLTPQSVNDNTVFPPDRFQLSWSGSKWQIYENLDAFPRAFFLSDGSWIGDGPDMIKKIYSEPLPSVIPAIITHYEPTRVEITVDAPSDGYLVLTDTYYAGWKALVDDDQSVAITPAFHAFRGVKIVEGTHAVVFDYKSL